MKCECKDFNQCVSCVKYDTCDDKPENPNVKWVLLYFLLFLVTTIILIVK